jgi:hypothetical protein
VVVAEGSKSLKTPPPTCVWMRGRWRWWQRVRNRLKPHLRLAFGREGGGGGNGVKTPENSTSSSLLDAREMEVAAEASKGPKNPPPARFWMRGRWRWWQRRQNARKLHLQLAFGREGGGDGGNDVETTSSSCFNAREVVLMPETSNRPKSPPPARIWTRGRWRWW